MASVFLSYDREDTARAAEIAAALESASHSVWWDHHIRGGAQYSKEIERALNEADAVVVLWSKSSVDSAWVRDEAAEGRDRGKLVPVSIDSARPPIGFRQFQTIDLTKNRRSRQAANGLNELLKVVSGPAVPEEECGIAAAQPKATLNRQKQTLLGAALVLAAAGITLVVFKPFASGGNAEVSAAVAPLDPSPDSKAFSDDLVTKLGPYAAQDGATLRLVGSGQGSHAAFMFQIGGYTEGDRSRANLLLVDGRSSTVLWTGQFDRPAASVGDLHQEVGYTASQVLGCASDAYRSRQLISKLDLLKSFLEACAAAAATDTADPAVRASQFRRIVDGAPKFVGGWAQLLLAESVTAVDNAEQRRRVQGDIARARSLRPDLPEAYVAEMNVLPSDGYAPGLELMDDGLRRNPTSSLLLGSLAELLISVGRMSDAVADAKRAAEIDPASPVARNFYIYALANSGRTDAAFEEIEKAERYWPGSSDIARTKYILNSRYGDPAKALAYVESSAYVGDVERARIYLQARMKPTPANIDRAIEASRDAFRADNPQSAASLLQILGMFGRQKELLDLVMRMPSAEFVPIQDVLFRPTMRILWLDPRSLLLAKRLGLLQYWNSSGKWPDFCSQPNFPYDCKKEAAKLLA
jgi:adenylate cyclase